MFQAMMKEMNSVTIQRLFRTQIQGVEQSQNVQQNKVKNLKVTHKDTTGMGFRGAQPQRSNQPEQVRTPIKTEQKQGRNDKILVRSPDGSEIEIKFKKLQNYINKGYSRI